MKKLLLLIITFFCMHLVYGASKQTNASANGTVVNGQYMIEDFEGKTLSESLEMGNRFGQPIVGTATAIANPTSGSQKVAGIVITSGNYNTFLKLNVTLPAGKSMANFTHIAFDLYRSASGDADYKKMYISVDGSTVFEDVTYIQQANTTTWTTKTYAIPGSVPTANNFELLLGISTDAGNYMIDNVRLSYTLSTAPTALNAANINVNSFTANWEALFGVENYRLDVATDAAFTSMVSGYNNLNVGNVLTYQISGLAENTTYYYRVRGAKTNGTSPSSSTITVLTEASGPIDPYVAPNLDPVAETDPTPATVAVPTIFVIDDYESRNINDALLVNNSSNAAFS